MNSSRLSALACTPSRARKAVQWAKASLHLIFQCGMSSCSMLMTIHRRYSVSSCWLLTLLVCSPCSHHSASSTLQQSQGASRMSDLYSFRLRSLSCLSRMYSLICRRMALMQFSTGCSRKGSTGSRLVLQLCLMESGKSTFCEREVRCLRLLVQGVISGVCSSFLPLLSVTRTAVSDPALFVPLLLSKSLQLAQTSLMSETGDILGAPQLMNSPGLFLLVLLRSCSMCHSACRTLLKLSNPSSTFQPSWLRTFARWMVLSASMQIPTSVSSCFFISPLLKPHDPLSCTTFAASEKEVGLKYSPTCFSRRLNSVRALVRMDVLRLPQQPVKLNMSPYCRSQQTSSRGVNESRLRLGTAEAAFYARTATGETLFPLTLKTPSPRLAAMASLTSSTEDCQVIFLCFSWKVVWLDLAMFSYMATYVADRSSIFRTIPLRPSSVSISRMYCSSFHRSSSTQRQSPLTSLTVYCESQKERRGERCLQVGSKVLSLLFNIINNDHNNSYFFFKQEMAMMPLDD